MVCSALFYSAIHLGKSIVICGWVRSIQLISVHLFNCQSFLLQNSKPTSLHEWYGKKHNFYILLSDSEYIGFSAFCF